MSLASLPAERLFRPCDPACFPFETTVEVPDLDQFIGQDRAEAAIRFAAGMRHDGYNLYALGPAGTGKRSLVEQLLRKRAAQEPVPDDWCYVHNFAAPHRTRALRLPAGRGARLRGDMVRLVEELRVAIPGAFEADQYRTRVKAIHAEYGERQEKALRELGDEAAAHDIALLRMPDGFVFAPVREGKVLSP
jgi:hypothetical protein